MVDFPLLCLFTGGYVILLLMVQKSCTSWWIWYVVYSIIYQVFYIQTVVGLGISEASNKSDGGLVCVLPLKTDIPKELICVDGRDWKWSIILPSLMCWFTGGPPVFEIPYILKVVANGEQVPFYPKPPCTYWYIYLIHEKPKKLTIHVGKYTSSSHGC